MTSWQIIMEFFVRGKQTDTVGYLKAIRDAGRLFILLRGYLSDLESATVLLNDNEPLREALLLGEELDNL